MRKLEKVRESLRKSDKCKESNKCKVFIGCQPVAGVTRFSTRQGERGRNGWTASGQHAVNTRPVATSWSPVRWQRVPLRPSLSKPVCSSSVAPGPATDERSRCSCLRVRPRLAVKHDDPGRWACSPPGLSQWLTGTKWLCGTARPNGRPQLGAMLPLLLHLRMCVWNPLTTTLGRQDEVSAILSRQDVIMLNGTEQQLIDYDDLALETETKHHWI